MPDLGGLLQHPLSKWGHSTKTPFAVTTSQIHTHVGLQPAGPTTPGFTCRRLCSMANIWRLTTGMRNAARLRATIPDIKRSYKA